MSDNSSDLAIPIVFPDYLIAVNTPEIDVDLPGSWLDMRIPSIKNKLPELGHAGILFVHGASGLCRYYEFGRYDPAGKGLVKKRQIPDVLCRGGQPTRSSLASVLQAIVRAAGQGGRIEGAYIPLPNGAFARMDAHARLRLAANQNAARASYGLLNNSCLHFMKEVAEAGGAAMPTVLDPRPVAYIGRVRSQHADLDFRPGGVPIVEGITLR